MDYFVRSLLVDLCFERKFFKCFVQRNLGLSEGKGS